MTATSPGTHRTAASSSVAGAWDGRASTAWDCPSVTPSRPKSDSPLRSAGEWGAPAKTLCRLANWGRLDLAPVVHETRPYKRMKLECAFRPRDASAGGRAGRPCAIQTGASVLLGRVHGEWRLASMSDGNVVAGSGSGDGGLDDAVLSGPLGTAHLMRNPLGSPV